MKKKKNGVILILGVAILVTTIHISFLYNKDFNSQTITKNEKNNPVLKNESLSMMFETSEGSGVYEARNNSTWPTSGYVFNSTNSKCENGGTLSYVSSTNVVRMEASRSDKCYVYFDVEASAPTPTNLADYIKALYTTDGTNNLYYHNGSGSYTNANLEAGDNSYRYAGANPNNWICFGTSAATCPSDNLYRIIGVFDDNVKLIKSTPYLNGIYYAAGKGYMWSGEASNKTNVWSESLLYKKTLNGIVAGTSAQSFRGSFSSSWQNKIYTTFWTVGGMREEQGMESNAKTAYDYEVGTSSLSTTYPGDIGLMYLSDYYYAASPTYWSYKGTEYSASTSNNWINYPDKSEWTITRIIRDDDFLAAYVVYATGNAFRCNVALCEDTVRPVFYLKSNVTLESGTGASTSPYRIVE